MKFCNKCKNTLSEDNFYPRASRPGFLSTCRECRKVLNNKNYADNKERTMQGKEKRIVRNQQFIASVLQTGCVDCGTKDIRVLEFDHLKDKTIGISHMRTHSLERLKEEISKCEVVCANCHNIRTSTRRADWRHRIYLTQGGIDERSSCT
jgi:hypothetical protein